MSLGNNSTTAEGFDLSDPNQNLEYSQMMTTRFTETFGMGEFFSRLATIGDYDFVFVNAAGNMSHNAQANSWPEFVDNDFFQDRLIVVGSYGQNILGEYRFSSFSNYGERVDILAPGESI